MQLISIFHLQVINSIKLIKENPDADFLSVKLGTGINDCDYIIIDAKRYWIKDDKTLDFVRKNIRAANPAYKKNYHSQEYLNTFDPGFELIFEEIDALEIFK